MRENFFDAEGYEHAYRHGKHVREMTGMESSRALSSACERRW
jgi:hypothetical protein